MKTKKIKLTKDQYNTIKLLFVCTCPAISRSLLSYVYYNSKRKEVVATNGYVLRCEEMDLGEDSLFFDEIFFSLTTKKYEFICHEFNEYQIDVLIEDDDNKYCDYVKIIPDNNTHIVYENGFPVCLDLNVLEKIRKSMTGTHRPCCFVTTNSAISGIKIYRLDWESENYKFIGIIMPVRFLGFNEFKKMTPEPTKENQVN